MRFSELLSLTAVAPDRWNAPGAPPTDERVVFGGLVVAQAVLAASAETRRLHALHAFFIGGGEKERPFEIAVERTRDGGSFSTRHVEIRQGERLLLAAYTSHHDGNEGPEHQMKMPNVPPPDQLEGFADERRQRDRLQEKTPRQYLWDAMLDVRVIDTTTHLPKGSEARMALWFRAREAVAGNQAMHQAVIAFASDFPLVHVGMRDHARTSERPLQAASLDHSLWFHGDARADEWMLYVLHSPVVGNGRGLSQGSIFSHTGDLIASVAQEFLARSGKTGSKSAET